MQKIKLFDKINKNYFKKFRNDEINVEGLNLLKMYNTRTSI